MRNPSPAHASATTPRKRMASIGASTATTIATRAASAKKYRPATRKRVGIFIASGLRVRRRVLPPPQIRTLRSRRSLCVIPDYLGYDPDDEQRNRAVDQPLAGPERCHVERQRKRRC